MSHDTSLMHNVAGWVGHAGPTSTLHYMHLYERALERHARVARPSAWAAAQSGSRNSAFPPLSARTAAVAEPRPKVTVRRLQSADIDLAARRSFASILASGGYLESAATSLEVPKEVGLQLATELVETLLLSRMVAPKQEWTVESRCDVIEAFGLWERASNQPKHRLLAQALDRDVKHGRLTELGSLWHAWSSCRSGEHLSLEFDRPSRKLVDYLLAAGIPGSSLLLVQAREEAGPGQRVTELRLPPRNVDPRPGRPGCRLQWSESDVPAVEASGAALSMVGLHWHFAVLGSYLLAREIL